MSDKTSAANADGVFEPFHVDAVPWQEVLRGRRFGMRYQHLSSYGGGTQISVSMEVLPPGRQANPAHDHLLEEEHVFVLEGRLTVELGARRHALGPGHYVCFPAGQAVGHALVNRSTEPCRYLVLGNPQAHDVAVFPDTKRVDVKLMRRGYRDSATIDYWEGIDVDREA